MEVISEQIDGVIMTTPRRTTMRCMKIDGMYAKAVRNENTAEKNSRPTRSPAARSS